MFVTLPPLFVLMLTAAGVATADEPRSIVFNGEVFVVKHYQSLPTEVVNEYFRELDDMETWRQMISVRWFSKLSDHRAAVGNFIKVLLAHNPNARYSIWQVDQSDAIGVDFVTWQNDDFVEFDIFIYHPHPSGKGLIANQYARRAYGDDRLVFMEGLSLMRREMLEKVIAFRFPEPVSN